MGADYICAKMSILILRCRTVDQYCCGHTCCYTDRHKYIEEEEIVAKIAMLCKDYQEGTRSRDRCTELALKKIKEDAATTTTTANSTTASTTITTTTTTTTTTSTTTFTTTTTTTTTAAATTSTEKDERPGNNSTTFKHEEDNNGTLLNATFTEY